MAEEEALTRNDFNRLCKAMDMEAKRKRAKALRVGPGNAQNLLDAADRDYELWSKLMRMKQNVR